MSEDGLLSRLFGRDAEEEDSRIYSAEGGETRRSRRRMREHKEGEKDISEGGLLSRLLGRDAEEEDSRIYSAEEVETRRPRRRMGEHNEGQRPPRGLSVQRIAETIAELPPTVPREHAVLIVRRTLAAADIKLSELDASTQEQELQLSSEIELAKNRQREVQEKSAETIRSLEEEIRRAREACGGVVAYEEKKISNASATLKEVRRVRAFFDLPETETEENTARIDQDTQVFNKPFDVGRTSLVRGRSGSPDDTDHKTHYGAAEGPSVSGATSDTSEE